MAFPRFTRFATLSTLLLATTAAFAGTVTISSPGNGTSVSSPFRLTAKGSDSDGVKVMKVYLDGSLVYEQRSGSIDTELSASKGSHRITVVGYDNLNNSFRSSVEFSVTSTSASTSSGGSVSISSPSSGSTVSSPFRVTATGSDSDGVKLMKVYLDGSVVYEVRSGSLDTQLSASTGSHRLTIVAYDNYNNSFRESVNFTVGSTTSSTSKKTYNDIEEMDGWGHCTECAGGGEQAEYTMTRNQSSPSIDGNSTKFWIGGTTPYSHGLWWRRMASDTSSSNFVLEMSYYIKDPSASQGLEFAVNQSKNDNWYKWSTQCSFSRGVWKTWDSKYGTWRETSIPCTRPKAYTWTHLKLEYQRVDGKAKFIAFTINGQKHYVNKSFYPQPKDSSGSVGVHYQMNGNKYQDDYTTWVDNMKLTTW